MNELHCNACQGLLNDDSEYFRCTRCHCAFYCNKDCQVKHWSIHKLTCNKDEPTQIPESLASSVGEFVNTVTIDDLNHNIGVIRRLKIVASQGKYTPTRMDEAFCQGLLKPLPLFYEGCAQLQDSPIHGRGLFAVLDIPANTIITYHPAHFIFTKGGYYAHNGQAKESHYTLAAYKRSYSYECVVGCGDLVRERFILIGDPGKTDNPLLLGHMLNDSCGNIFHKVKATKLRKERYFIDLVKKYYTTMEKNRNCGIDENSNGSVVCIMTTRDVKKGEELLTGYGMLYWLTYEYGETYHELYPYIEKNTQKMNMDPNFGDFLTQLYQS